MTGSRRLMFGDDMSIFARSVREPSGNSPYACGQKVEVFLDRPIAVRTTAARFRERPSKFAYLVGAQVAHIALPAEISMSAHSYILSNNRTRNRAGRRNHSRAISRLNNGLDVLVFLFARVRVVEAQIEFASESLPYEVDVQGLRMPDMQVPVGFRRKPGDHFIKPARPKIIRDRSRIKFTGAAFSASGIFFSVESVIFFRDSLIFYFSPQGAQMSI